MELENQILGVERQGDLPGELIPYVYFEYVRTQEIFRLMPVFHHNAIDILTLACLTAIVPRAFNASEAAELAHGAEMVGLARWWRQAEQHENALALFRQAVEKNLSDDLLFRTLWDIAALEKKLGREHAAIPVLTDLASFAQSVARGRARRTGEILRTPRTQLRAGARNDAQRAGIEPTEALATPRGATSKTHRRSKNI